MSELYRIGNDAHYPRQEVEPSQSASDMLRTAREEQGLSQREVADRLFLSETFVRYIDDGEFHKIPKQPFVKGYLRSYARVVNLSGDEVVACYQKSLDEARDVIEPRDLVEESVGANNLTGPVVQTGIAGLAGLLVIVALVWWLASGDKTETPEPTVTTASTTSTSTTSTKSTATNTKPSATSTESTASVDATIALPVDEGNTSTLTEPDPIHSAAETNSGVNDANNDAGNDVSVERVAEGGKTYITVKAGGDDRLELSFSDECWVEIQDAQGDSIYADLNHEGDVLKISGMSPFEVLLGRASSVGLYFNDESIDLGRYITSNNTARVTLGN